MNAEVTFRDEQGDHKVKLMSFENMGALVRGWQKVRKSFVRRTIGAAEVTNIRELPETKLRELITMTPVRVMFRNGYICEFRSIYQHDIGKLKCVEEDNDERKESIIEGRSPVTVIFD